MDMTISGTTTSIQNIQGNIPLEISEHCKAIQIGKKMEPVMVLEFVERLFERDIISPESFIMHSRDEEHGECEVFLKPYSIKSPDPKAEYIYYNVWTWSETASANSHASMGVLLAVLRANFPKQNVLIDSLLVDML